MENGDKLNMSNSCGAAVLSKKGTFEEDEADKKGSSANADTCGDLCPNYAGQKGTKLLKVA